MRHKKATQLYTLAFEKKISESVAAQLMGHSASMMKTYVHRPDKQTIKILKEQAFNTEISEEKKHELEDALENEKKARQKLEKKIANYDTKFKQMKNTNSQIKVVMKMMDDLKKENSGVSS